MIQSIIHYHQRTSIHKLIQYRVSNKNQRPSSSVMGQTDKDTCAPFSRQEFAATLAHEVGHELSLKHHPSFGRGIRPGEDQRGAQGLGFSRCLMVANPSNQSEQDE